MNDNSKIHVNDVVKTMLERSSIRAYTGEKLTEEQISILREAALSAPHGDERTGSAVCFCDQCGCYQRA